MIERVDEAISVDLRAEELAQDFSYDGYQVVRRELFAHLREPAVVIRKDSITFNTACIAGLEDTIFVQILVNPENKRMVVRGCQENDKDALRWCVEKPDKRKSRKVSSKIFSAKIYDLMGWHSDCRYKILGHKIEFDGELIYVFELLDTEIYIDKKKKDVSQDEVTASSENDQNHGTEKNTNKRKPYYPEEWRDSFGLPIEQHKKSLEINIVNGFASFDT